MKPPTRAPFYACMYPGLCDIARANGYALAIHGTLTSDLDLIACPWTDEAIDAEALFDLLKESIAGMNYREHLIAFGLSAEHAQQIVDRDGEKTRCPTLKPHGRLAWNIYHDAGCRVDLSVMPRAQKGTP